MKSSASKRTLDNRANQLNPGHPTYHLSRGATSAQAQVLARQSKPVLDNRSRQLSPNNPEYHGTRQSGHSVASVPSSKQRP